MSTKEEKEIQKIDEEVLNELESTEVSGGVNKDTAQDTTEPAEAGHGCNNVAAKCC